LAGNLKDMMGGFEMIGNDLNWRSSTVAPTIKIAEMDYRGALSRFVSPRAIISVYSALDPSHGGEGNTFVGFIYTVGLS